MENKEWNYTLDFYLTNGFLESDEYERMYDDQKRIIQELKKAFKRINK